MSRRFACCFCIALLSLFARPVRATASALLDAALDSHATLTDVLLHFDAAPPYSASWRYNPDRYVLSFAACRLAVPKAHIEALAKLPGSLLTRVSLAQS